MYPDLSYLFHDLFGSQPDNFLSIFKTFGLFLALAFLASAYTLFLEFKRKESEGLLPFQYRIQTLDQKTVLSSAVTNALVGFFILFKIPYIAQHFAEFKLDPASVVFSSKGNILLGLLGAAIFGAYAYYNASNHPDFGKTIKYKSYPSQRVSDITIVAAISGILGARIFSIFENMDAFWADPLGTLLSGSGLTVYGGLIVAFAAVYWYVHKLGIKPIHVMDAVAPALVVGYGVGRMGCQFSGDGDWGIVNDSDAPSWFFLPDSFWSYSYPRNVLNKGVEIQDCIGHYCNELSPGVYPTPVYEIFMCAIILAILWALRKRIKIPGLLFFIYLTLNGIERFFIEKIRVNDRYDVLGFNWSLSQAIAVAFILIGLIACGYLWFYKKESGSNEGV